MEVRVEVSVVSAMPAMPGRSRSKRFRSSAEKCWESAAEPPLPQLMTLPSCLRDSAISLPAARMCGTKTCNAACLVAILSWNCLVTLSCSLSMIPSARLECVLYPFYRVRPLGSRYRHHVEAQGSAAQFRVGLQQMLGGEGQLAL